MRGENGRNLGAAEPADELRAVDAGRLGAGERMREIAGPVASGMAVLCDVDQMQEVTERTHHVQRVVDRKAVEQRFQFHARGGTVGAVFGLRIAAAKAHRRLPDVLDRIEARQRRPAR